MAKSTLNSKELVQRSFSPFVAILSSPLVDEVCQKNNLSFIELIEPFSTVNKEVSYRDPSATTITLKNLRVCFYDINAKPPEPAIARKLLNESVSSVSEEVIECTNFKSGNISVDVPTTVPWFEKWRDMFLKVQFPSDHEFTKHYLACMIVITSKEDNPMDTLSNMVQQLQHTLSMSPPKMIPKWFSSSVLRYYVLLHDVVSGDLKKAEKVFDEMKSTYNTQCCYMLQINSQTTGSPIIVPDYWGKTQVENGSNEFSNDIGLTDSFSMSNSSHIETAQEMSEQVKPEILNHPLSPQLENQRIGGDVSQNINDMTDSSETPEKPGACLTTEDIDRVKTLVSNFVVSALLPFVETQMQYLNEMVSNKKGVSKSFLSATKRWFGNPKPGSPISVPNAHYYHPDSPELHMRRLGDLCFMFGAYTCAFQAYHSAKRDFSSDSAWLYYAGALEMAALSAFLIGLDIKKAQEYTEDSVVIYLNTCRMPQFATRLTLCVTECLKDLGMYGEAAGRLLSMTSEDSDLRSALLLEEASYCFIKSKKPYMPRKYAFHLVLAGHRFAKAGQRRHSLRCYRQAYQVYQDKSWSLAEDHIHFTIGKLASSLKQKEVTAAEFAKLFINPSTQLPSQQSVFLKEYFLSLIELQKEGKSEMPFLNIPHVDHSSIRVFLNAFESPDRIEEWTLAHKKITEEEQTNNRWRKLEENLVSFTNNNSVPPFFKPTITVLSNSTNNSVKPVCVIEERIRTCVDLVNILNISLSLQNVELMWEYSASENDPNSDEISLAETEILDSVILERDTSTTIILHITPKSPGELHISGIKYTVILQPSNEGADTISITGYTTLNPKGMKIITKEPKAEPQYAPDYRLQFTVADSAPCLQIYLKHLTEEMLCGEIQPIVVKLRNTGRLPINRVLFTASEPALFSVPKGKPGSKIYQLQFEPIPPGRSNEVTIFLKASDKSGETCVDLLFYYDTTKSSHQKLKYRLIHHTLNLMVHESISASVLATRSIKNNEDNEVINIRLQVQNKNEASDALEPVVSLQQVSLFSSNWQLYGVISSSDDVSVKLKQEQVAFVTFKAKRLSTENNYSDLILNNENSILSVEKPYSDFTESIVTKLINPNKPPDKNIAHETESVVNINSLVILFWKGEVNRKGSVQTITGQHLVPLMKFGQKYSSADCDSLCETNKPPTLSSFISPPSIPTVYYNSPIAKELLLIKMSHPAIVTHSFTSNRICTVSVDLIVQNCCDYSVEVKLDSTYQTPNNLSKINESSLFLWLGVVLNTFVLEKHSSTKMSLCVCVGNCGTYDLGSQLTILARKFNSENIFVAQSSVPHSILCVSNDVL
ncbi:trafficking protein particle complex subunit 8 [Planococcus citri]|uniref:trafficking protein particle complex subunit 8 n=1 Tax=Planococcus citri TaxID=170843 RepID=UPI0031F809D0